MNKSLIFATIMVTLLATNTAWATATGACNSEEAVKKADKLWADTLQTHNPDAMAKLYAHDAILLGTYENIPLVTNEQRVQYFTQLYKKVPNIRVEYNQTHIKLLKEDAISSGLYTFIGNENGKEIRMPARYSFAYDSTDQGCVLVMHHSSALPLEYTNEDQIK